MQTTIQFKNQTYQLWLDQPLDISIPLHEGTDVVNCFYAPLLETSPVIAGDFIGSTAQGGPVNFMNVRLNPHGNGTHTECVGHIAREPYSINDNLKQFHFVAKLVSLFPQRLEDGDRVIMPEQIREVFTPGETEAIVIRTLPNDELKLRRNYSGTNPPYLHHKAIDYLVEGGIKHLLIDLPSVDREQDDGKLRGHRAFWKYPGEVRTNCTISELVFVDNAIKDGLYLLNLQIASFEIDVSPSKPVLYRLTKMDLDR